MQTVACCFISFAISVYIFYTCIEIQTFRQNISFLLCAGAALSSWSCSCRSGTPALWRGERPLLERLFSFVLFCLSFFFCFFAAICGWFTLSLQKHKFPLWARVSRYKRRPPGGLLQALHANLCLETWHLRRSLSAPPADGGETRSPAAVPRERSCFHRSAPIHESRTTQIRLTLELKGDKEKKRFIKNLLNTFNYGWGNDKKN